MDAHAQLPTGNTLIRGGATVSQPNAQSQVITQTTPRAIIDWRSFSIGTGNSVRIIQDDSSSILLNRVAGPPGTALPPSMIDGSLWATGRVFLVNPAGIF